MFDYTYGGAGHDYARINHAFLISSDVDASGTQRIEVPGVAESWEISSDGLQWVFQMRDGVKFHDGTDATAADMLWTLDHVLGPAAFEYGGAGSVSLSKVTASVDQTGPNEITITNNEIATYIPERLGESSGGWYGALLPKRPQLHSDAAYEAYNENPIGAGPGRLIEHVLATQMLFERFDDFYQQTDLGYPKDNRWNFSQLDLLLVPEEATRVAAIRAGQADIGAVSLGSKGQIEAGGGRIIFGPEGTLFDVALQGCWQTPTTTPAAPVPSCSDKRVRQALNYAIDKELIRDQLYGGPEVMTVGGWLHITPSTLGYSSAMTPYPFDPDKARSLMADAGFPDGDGFGEMIINTFISPALPLMPEAALLIADMWNKELGIDARTAVGDQGALSASNRAGQHPGEVYMRDNETRLDGSGNLRNRYTNNADKPGRLSADTVVNDIMQAAASNYDDRQSVLNEAYIALRDDAVFIVLGYLNIPWGVGPNVVEWQPFPLANYPSGLHNLVLK